MNIVFITDQLYKAGGIERVLSLKANYMARVFNWDITILTSEQKGKQTYFELNSKIDLIDISINYNRDKSYFSFENLKRIPRHLFELRKTINKIEPDYVISVSFGLDFYWLPFINKSIKKVKEFHSSRYYDFYQNRSIKQKWKLKIRAYIENKYDRLIILNPGEKQYYKNRDISVIPNPAPNTKGTPAKLDTKKVMAAGRIAPVKGFDTLVAAWELVVEKHPEWQLDIFGDDYLGTAGKLNEMIFARGLENSVRLMGATPNIVNEMKNYSLYLMTSKTECFPMVLLESMSVGLPVVSFDCPTGPKFILLEEQAELLVPDQNVEVFADKVSRLISNKSSRLYYGRQAQKVAKEFSLNGIMEVWQNTLVK